MLLLQHIFTKLTSNVMYVTINKQLICFQNFLCILLWLCQGNSKNTFSHFKCLHGHHNAASQATYKLSGPFFTVNFLENNTFLDRMTLNQLIHMSTTKTVLKFQSTLMLCCVIWYVVTNILKDHNAFIFWLKQIKKNSTGSVKGRREHGPIQDG